ncbi:MAG: excinuclease ABC subunit UvrC [Polyangiaceae bacterium]
MDSAGLLQKLDGLPVQPGVYMFKDKNGAVIYVGKAKSLRSRVRSYFQESSGDTRAVIPLLLRAVVDLETLVTANEKEATILENNLIKQYAPRYNVKLRDDKDFITLRLGKVSGQGREPSAWPRLEVVRRPKPDGASYFGPYHSAGAARTTLRLVNKHFQLRTCGDTELSSRKRPCLQHQIKRCPAPCVIPVDRAWYGEQVDAVAKFLEGRHDDLSRELADKMMEAARAMRFELATVYRDQVRAIEQVRQSQRIVTIDDIHRDVVGLYREGDLVEIAVLHIRAGRLIDVSTYSIRQAEIPDDEIVAAFVAQHHGAALRDADGETGSPLPALAPDEIIVPCELEGMAGIAQWLSDRAGHRVELLVPKRGHRVQLAALAQSNAQHAFAEKRRQNDDVTQRLQDLQDRLRLPCVPHHIECCDISHLGGADTVGAIVAMVDGELDRGRYRTFHVRGDAMPSARATGGSGAGMNDDYGAMYEVLARRFRRAVRAAASAPSDRAKPLQRGADASQPDGPWNAPDLFVVDGGRGQLAVALAAAHDLGLHDMAIVGLAKERETALGETLVDRIYLPGQKNPIALKSGTTSLFLLARLRDEAHRVSNRARTRLGTKRRIHSPLDDIRGLGPSAKKALLSNVGNLAAIRAADDATLLAVPGITKRHVTAVRAAFPQEPLGPDAPTEGPTGHA